MMSTAEDLHQLDDRELMAEVRQGNVDSFAHLYQRHVTAAATYARRLVRQNADEHDVVADAFLRVFGILSRGLGPKDSFRPYLLRAVRNAAYDRTRAERRLALTDELSMLEGAQPFHDTAVEKFDRDLVLQAFRNLPVRWQKVLWLTLIEELPVDDAATRLGINANSLTSLAYRAREGLRQSYLEASLAAGGNQACRRAAAALSRFVRGTVAVTDRRMVMVEEHLGSCTDCRARIREVYETDAVLWDRSVAATPASQPAVRSVRARHHATQVRLARGPGLAVDDYCVPA
jgi:RNA polymerase sigma factor (sigma-70 family)